VKLSEILTGIRELPYCYEEEAVSILSALCVKFKDGTIAGDAILDAIMVIEDVLDNSKAENDEREYLESPDYTRDLFAARSERGL